MSPAFARAAEIARDQRKKPIIALKTGRSEQGAKVAMSHTSSLAGADTLYDALFERYGIARMNSVTAFVETLKFLHHGGAIARQPARVDELLGRRGRTDGRHGHGEEGAPSRPSTPSTKPKVAATLNEYRRHRQSARLSHLHLEPGGQADRDLLRRAAAAASTWRC